MQITPFGAAAAFGGQRSLGQGIDASGPLESDSVIAQRPTQPITSGPKRGQQDDQVLRDAIDGVRDADGTARVGIDDRTNAATFLGGNFGVVVRPGVGGSGPDRFARTFLARHGSLFGIADQHSELKLAGIEKDELGMRHFRYEQVHDGLPVFGQEIVVHAQDDRVTSVAGRITPNIGTAEPRLAALEAARSAITTQRAALDKDGIRGVDLKAEGDQQLGWFTLENGEPRLAYEVVVGSNDDQRWQMYVDAASGDVIERWSLVHSALNRETVDAKSGRVRREGQAASGDEVLDKAHDNAKGVYDFLKSSFNRDSIDDKGMKLKSVVHHGNKYNNAFWNGSQMTYGDGDGVRFSPLGNAIDVVGHEMLHGVTERSAGLRYIRQSGALNESWSDVFGNLIEKWEERRDGKPESDPDWFIGEQVFTPGTKGDGLRSMSKPGTAHPSDPQPAHMKNYVDTSADNGGVHINSGIPNKAAYEIGKDIGQEKLSAIWYRALTKYMTSSTQFSEAANMTVQSAIDLYGRGSAEAKAVVTGWTEVGLTPSVSLDVPARTPQLV